MRKVGSGTCTFLLTINRGKGEKKAGGKAEKEEGRRKIGKKEGNKGERMGGRAFETRT